MMTASALVVRAMSSMLAAMSGMPLLSLLLSSLVSALWLMMASLLPKFGAGEMREVLAMLLVLSEMLLLLLLAALASRVRAASKMLAAWMKLLLLLSPTSCVEPSSELGVCPPGSYTNSPLSLVLKSLALHGWVLLLRLR